MLFRSFFLTLTNFPPLYNGLAAPLQSFLLCDLAKNDAVSYEPDDPDPVASVASIFFTSSSSSSSPNNGATYPPALPEPVASVVSNDLNICLIQKQHQHQTVQVVHTVV